MHCWCCVNSGNSTRPGKKFIADDTVHPDDSAGLNNGICEQVPVPTTLRSALMTWTRQNLMA